MTIKIGDILCLEIALESANDWLIQQESDSLANQKADEIFTIIIKEQMQNIYDYVANEEEQRAADSLSSDLETRIMQELLS